jgi:hypothetical protein
MGSSRRLPLRSILWVATVLLFAGAVTFALFSQTTANAGNTYASSSDWKAPTVDRAVIQRNGGSNASTGYVKQGQSYFVYANVTDTGNPASGISSVTANVSTVTTGQTAAALSFGSWTVNGQTYNYRSSALTSANPLSEGSKSFSIAAADNNSNSATTGGFSVTVDNTAPSVARATVEKSSAAGGSGYLKQGQSYYVYAQVTDSSSGVDTVTANVSTISAGQTSVSMTSGSWTIGGQTYNYRSTSTVTSDNPLSEGSKSYSVTANDNVTNSVAQGGFSATIDNTAPTISRATIQRTDADKGAGYVKGGLTYYVYAEVTDSGSGVNTASVTATDTNFTNDATPVTLTYNASGYSVGGQTYHYRSVSRTAKSQTAGSYSFTVSASDNVSNSTGNVSFSATYDTAAPTVSKVACGGYGCTAGWVGRNQTYYIYAQATDSSSGVDTVTTDPRSITSTANQYTAMSPSEGPWTVGGVSYNYRSIQLTADGSLTGGSSYSYSVSANDNVTNSTSPTGSATADNTAPTVGTPVIAKTPGRLTGETKASGDYFVYADPTDANSGIDTTSVTANAAVASNVITTSQPDVDPSSVPMCYSASGYTVGWGAGTTYHYKSDADASPCDGNFTALTADNSLAEGSRTFQVSADDNAGNSATGSSSVTIDNTSDTGSSIDIKNSSGGTSGQLEQNDTIIYTFGDSVDPESILSGWDGTGDSTGNVVVRLLDGGGGCVSSSDRLQVFNATNTTVTSLGTICLGGTDYNTSGSTITFGASGTPSRLAQTGAGGVITVTLGTWSTPAGTSGDTTGRWAVSASAYDSAGNAYQATTLTNQTIDNTAPTISAMRICGGSSCTADYVGQGKTYYIYANASDAGSGIDTISADVSTITTNASSVALTSCSSGCTVGGTTYTYKSAAQTANGTLSGTKTWTLTVQDAAANQTGPQSQIASVDNTIPSILGEIVCGGGTCGGNGYVGQGNTYYVYANASDGASGVDSVTADVSNITTGASSVTLTSCSSGCTVNGTTYSYKSAAQTAKNPLSGSPSWSITVKDNALNQIAGSWSAGVDNSAPNVTASAIAKASGTGLYLSGKIKASGTYYVYANISESGGSGLDTETANVAVTGNVITTGQTSVPLISGSYSANGTSYNYRSAALTANSGLTNSTKSYTVTATDNAANSGSLSPNPTVTIDNTAPGASGTTKIQATNGGANAGRPEQGDQIIYTYTEQIDPESILAGWTGASTNVVVRLNDNIACPGSANANDNITIFDYPGNSTQVNLGCIDLAAAGYSNKDRTFGASGSATLSTMVQSGSAITITLGTSSGVTSTVSTGPNMVWWPSGSAFDAAGNLSSTISQAETDGDNDF